MPAPLDRVIWDMETAEQGFLIHRNGWPGWNTGWNSAPGPIADDKVQFQYLDAFRGRVRDLKYQSRQAKFGARAAAKMVKTSQYGAKQQGRPLTKNNAADLAIPAMTRRLTCPPMPLAAPEGLIRRREQGLLAGVD